MGVHLFSFRNDNRTIFMHMLLFYSFYRSHIWICLSYFNLSLMLPLLLLLLMPLFFYSTIEATTISIVFILSWYLLRYGQKCAASYHKCLSFLCCSRHVKNFSAFLQRKKKYKNLWMFYEICVVWDLFASDSFHLLLLLCGQLLISTA